ncbi:putative uncharacterized protein DDB_G0289263 [Microplitis demolitor]|uniref:putative uncharacterized protein DDB_G0289263 n=1 Tax=Microplitis demolitor TaxID=69319 RepID=UPI00235B639A|nr:putative uncharacterized protein DDB_G0289263 [Microplitis demolitor]
MNSILRLYILMGSFLITYVISIQVEHTFETVHTSNAAVLNRLGLTPIEIPEGHYKKRVSGPEPQALSSSLSYSSAQSRIHQPYSRRHGHHDSHIYVVKLPASPPYYTVTRPLKSMNKDNNNNNNNNNNIPSKSSTDKGIFDGGIDDSSVINQTPLVGFNSNGKPAKIYHWNLQLMKKLSEKKRLHEQFKMDQLRKKFKENRNNIIKNQDYKKNINSLLITTTSDIDDEFNKIFNVNVKNNNYNKYNGLVNDNKNIIFQNQTRNNDKLLNYYSENIQQSNKFYGISNKFNNQNSTRKMYRFEDNYNVKSRPNRLANDLNNNNNNKQYRIKAAVTYYAPMITKKITGLSINNDIHKNFPGNGKPKAFYVMEKSRRKPIYYHSLLS